MHPSFVSFCFHSITIRHLEKSPPILDRAVSIGSSPLKSEDVSFSVTKCFCFSFSSVFVVVCLCNASHRHSFLFVHMTRTAHVSAKSHALHTDCCRLHHLNSQSDGIGPLSFHCATIMLMQKYSGALPDACPFSPICKMHQKGNGIVS